jgi:hypothetical protein
MREKKSYEDFDQKKVHKQRYERNQKEGKAKRQRDL